MNRAYAALAAAAITIAAFTPIAAGADAVQGAICAGERVVRLDPALPPYQPQRIELAREATYVAADGTVVVIGYNDMRDILHAMETRFDVVHPEIRFRFDLPGTRFAPAALANGTSAFAPMGALFTPPQLAEYRSIAGNEPLGIRVAHASLDSRALSGPLAVFVHRDNPIRSLTLAQLEKVFAGDIGHWRELGVVSGQWAEREIHAYGMQTGTALAWEFQRAVMPERNFGALVAGVPQSAELVQKVTTDPAAIGFAAAMRATRDVRVLAIAANERAKPVTPTCETIIADRYPLDRHLLIYLPRPVTPVAREFVRFALSREGQQAVAASPQGYLPLSARDAAAELAKLE